ncbi:MAG: serine hydrolase [Planctomycetota bacterium]|nr:serine hydrolase [Planctomycetota bacterium]
MFDTMRFSSGLAGDGVRGMVRRGARAGLVPLVVICSVVSASGVDAGQGASDAAVESRAMSVGAAPTSIEGRWEGAINLPGVSLPIDIDFVKGQGGSMSGDISIPQQSAKDLRLDKIVVEGRRVAFTFPDAPGGASFAGELSEDGSELAGQFTQMGQQFPFKLKRAQAVAAEAKDKLDGVDDLVRGMLADWKAPGVGVAVVRGTEVLLSKGYGERDVEGKKPATEHTLFAIGSSSKAFTTYLMAVLAEQGKLDWDKPVREVLPEFRLADEGVAQRVTPRDLVTHRTGLPRHDLMWYNSGLSRGEIFARLRHLKLSEDLRAKWQYNNLMYLSAGVLVEKLTGQTWEHAVESMIFGPLKMEHSTVGLAQAQRSSELAQPYDEHEGAVRLREFRDISNVGPAGSIFSCARDMANWMIVHLNEGTLGGEKVIQGASLAELHRPQMTLGAGDASEPEIIPVGYALGWFVEVYRGRTRLHHGGNIDGFSTMVTLIPDSDLGIAVMANQDGSPVPELLTRHLLDRLLDGPKREWHAETLQKREQMKGVEKEAKEKKDLARVADTKPAHPIAAYAGSYEHPGYGVIRIELASGSKAADGAAESSVAPANGAGTAKVDAAKAGAESGATKAPGAPLRAIISGFTLPLEHWHFDVFSAGKVDKLEMFEGQKVQFLTGLDGSIEGLRLVVEPTLPAVEFSRRASERLSDPAFLSRLAGEYMLGPQALTVTARGSKLTLLVPGQPLYDLIPKGDNVFSIKGLEGFTVKFVFGDDGNVTELQSVQPNGVFTAKRR